VSTYRIVRFFRDHGREYLDHEETTGLTLEEAQAWCNDPETSSTTATGPAAQAVTRAKGAWFDGYEQED
jgi:hypothetical protein